MWLRNKHGGWFEIPDDEYINKDSKNKEKQIAANKQEGSKLDHDQEINRLSKELDKNGVAVTRNKTVADQYAANKNPNKQFSVEQTADGYKISAKEKQTYSKYDNFKYDAQFNKEALAEMKRYERNWSGMSARDKRNIAPGGIKELRSELSRLQSYADIPASFAANYPNLTNAQIKAKYEEFLKKNRK